MNKQLFLYSFVRNTESNPRYSLHALFLTSVRRQGIPEKERRECRKNALSEEMRHYLDTGTLPSVLNPDPVSKSDERRPVQAVPGREKSSSPNAGARSRRGGGSADGNCVSRVEGRPVINVVDGESGGDAHHADASPPAQATISIASLFGWGHDREKDEDY